ncbi:hypothetical protein U1Q18_007266 [Sarracenia purpurea var. burkii]
MKGSISISVARPQLVRQCEFGVSSGEGGVKVTTREFLQLPPASSPLCSLHLTNVPSIATGIISVVFSTSHKWGGRER